MMFTKFTLVTMFATVVATAVGAGGIAYQQYIEQAREYVRGKADLSDYALVRYLLDELANIPYDAELANINAEEIIPRAFTSTMFVVGNSTYCADEDNNVIATVDRDMFRIDEADKAPNLTAALEQRLNNTEQYAESEVADLVEEFTSSVDELLTTFYDKSQNQPVDAASVWGWICGYNWGRCKKPSACGRERNKGRKSRCGCVDYYRNGLKVCNTLWG